MDENVNPVGPDARQEQGALSPVSAELSAAANAPPLERKRYAYGETPHERIGKALSWLAGNYGDPLEAGMFPAITHGSDDPDGTASLHVRTGDVETLLTGLLAEGSPSSVALRVELLAALGIEEA